MMLLCSRDGQDSFTFTPYPALKLSPKTTITFLFNDKLSDEFTENETKSKIAAKLPRHPLKDLILEVKNITKEVNSPEGLLTIVKDINLSSIRSIGRLVGNNKVAPKLKAVASDLAAEI